MVLGWGGGQRIRQVLVFPLVISHLQMILAVTIRKLKLTLETSL